MKQAAILAAGLGERSRCYQALNGLKLPLETYLLADIVDALNLLVWFQSEDGQKNQNRPESVFETLVSGGKEKTITGFASKEEFEAWAKEIRNG